MQRRAKRKLLCRQVEVPVEQISRKEFLSKMFNCSFSFDLITEPFLKIRHSSLKAGNKAIINKEIF